MKNSYEQFNEITFESYCKKAIDRAVLKGRIKKSARAEREISLSTLTDEALPVELPKLAEEQEIMTFQVRGLHIPVNDTHLGQALLFLPPKKREVILLTYFLDMSDAQIGALLGKSRSDIQYQRTAAQKRLKRLLESGGGHMHLENCILDTPIRYLTFTLRGWIDDEYKHCHKLLFR